MRVARDWRHQTNKTQKTQLEGGNTTTTTDRQSKHTKRGTARLSTFFLSQNQQQQCDAVVENCTFTLERIRFQSIGAKLWVLHDANRPLEHTPYCFSYREMFVHLKI